MRHDVCEGWLLPSLGSTQIPFAYSKSHAATNALPHAAALSHLHLRPALTRVKAQANRQTELQRDQIAHRHLLLSRVALSKPSPASSAPRQYERPPHHTLRSRPQEGHAT